MKIRKLSIIVPVYNEKATIGGIFDKLAGLNLGGRKKEVIWVDDGSNEGSTLILRKLAERKQGTSGMKFLFHNTNQGKGAAIQTALKEAKGDYVIIQDADAEYNPDEIIRLVKHAEKNGLPAVFGSRDREIKNHYLYPHYYWGSKILCLLMNLFFAGKFTDPETCYKLVQTDLMKFIDITEKGFGVEMEMAAKIARLKIPYGEVAITYKPRSFAEGKKIGAKDGLRAAYLIGKYWEHDLHYGLVDRILRRIRLNETLKYLKLGKNDTVADMGCGRQATLGWKLRVRIGKYIGLDRDVPSLELGNIRLIRTDLNRKLLWGNNSTDIIIGAAILEHLENPVGFIRECLRVLKPGGRLALTTPAPPLADSFLKILVNLKLIKADEVYDHVRYFSLENLKKMAAGNRLKIVKAESFLFGLNNLIVVKK